MAGRKTKALAEARKRLELHYFLRGAGSREIAQSLRQHPQFQGGVSERQVRRDIRTLETQLHELTTANQLYSLKRAFAELEEIWREGWLIFHKPPQQVEVQGKLVTPDDRAVKLMALARLAEIIEMRCRLAGFHNPKILERITLVQTAAGQGVRWEHLNLDEQLEREVEALRRNEDLRKREGLSTDPDN